MTAFTNATAIRQGMVPCETNPDTGKLSMLHEVFHAQAVTTTGSMKGSKRHVCESCADKHHGLQHHQRGVKWD